MGEMMRLDQGQIEVVDDMMAEVLRRKTPAERMAIGNSLWRSARQLLMASVRDRHPDWDARRIQEEVAKRFLHGAS